jgi:hypothetical protein
VIWDGFQWRVVAEARQLRRAPGEATKSVDCQRQFRWWDCPTFAFAGAEVSPLGVKPPVTPELIHSII